MTMLFVFRNVSGAAAKTLAGCLETQVGWSLSQQPLIASSNTAHNLTVLAALAVMDVSGVKLVCDPASMLYLFGMRLDYSDALVGGGFQFQNPNAEDTCGCGKSFGV